MDNSNSRPPQADPNMVDWRTQLSAASRERIVNMIMDSLKIYLPISGPEVLIELKKIVVRFEEKTYNAATSQTDYLRKIALKLVTMETKYQNMGVANVLPPNSVVRNQNSADPASIDSTSHPGHANSGDWQEEAYQQIEGMNEMSSPDLNELYQKVCLKLQHDEYLAQLLKEQIERLKRMKLYLEHV